MNMTLRWYGPGYDSVSLEQIRQIPGVKGVVTTLMGKMPGEVWTKEEIASIKKEVEGAGLSIMGIESVNISDDIKIGTKKRDEHIANYITTLENLGKNDIHMICYNFMPVFDWTRSDLARMREDGSTVLAYNQDVIDEIDPEHMRESIERMSHGFVMPGWEPERLEKLASLFEAYKEVDSEKLFQNLVYFLEAIGETCQTYDIRMGIHPDDPAWPIFGLPRIVRDKDTVVRLLKAVDQPYNGITLCTGSLGSNQNNDICEIIRAAKGRIPFAHVRNLKYNSSRDFEEAAHLSADGSMDMYEIMKTLYETGFDGIMRPDHGRMIWGEEAMPGYGLYDRALGAVYLEGLWEAIVKNAKQR
ncbi:mannonate dehydratase [Clostridium sp. chh4-2]|uniref:mannonate dehydratase n=1 Tax=Clostridium sp. chh4-2 TaxID=2067550 RepID=UPI000CCE7C2A|nr:mannonate dehydratase [Clostridium sp. chh4-2]PNV60912.1 mannonate dehydratase [Clostridium sp. chh4-2]